MKRVIVVHGGAGKLSFCSDVGASAYERERVLLTIRRALEIGMENLKTSGNPLDAVEAAVKVLEDEELLNAGIGSVLNIEGNVEMDAAIMDGKTLRAGAVAMIRNVRHPVSLARKVMEKTDHVLLVGSFAEKLAEILGLEKAEIVTKRRLEEYRKLKSSFLEGKSNRFKKNLEIIELLEKNSCLGTVGAVAINSQGGVAAAVSTGGLSLKLPGRVGDSAIIGAGLYADNEAGACVATGIGEHAIRSCIAKTAVEFMRNGLNAQESVIKALKDAGKRIKGLYLGLIAVDREGEVGAAHTTPHMLWGKMVEGEKPVVSVRATLLT